MAPSWWKWPLALLLFYFLFFHGLDQVGLLSEDEPRYAAIALEMAQSGDWVTPRLWGEPWFEKPVLVYWMAAAGFLAGLGPELAPRLPVALLGAAFLAFFFLFLRREFGEPAAAWSTLLLGTSAGWLAYSHVVVMDVPLTATFGAAMLLYLAWLREERPGLLIAAAILLGLAVLAKGLVPLALALPALWFGRRRLGAMVQPAPLAAFLLTAAPWYLLCWWRNGQPFIDSLFIRHHFGRLVTDEVQHVQPFWFYVPVLLAGMFPWTPLLALLGSRKTLFSDPRCRVLLAWIAFGFVLFSISMNKLPGYLLPLFPAAAALMGTALAERPQAPRLLAACGLLLGLVPVIAAILPQALKVGLSRVSWAEVSPWWALLGVVLAAVVATLEARGHRAAAGWTLAIAVTAGIWHLQARAFPELDARVSARSLWREVEPRVSSTCVELSQLHRRYEYGLFYYAGRRLPDCASSPEPWKVTEADGLPVLVPGPAAGGAATN